MKITLGDRPAISLGRSPAAGARSLRIARQSVSDPVDWNKTETTRYLCATAHLDESFRDRVIHKLRKGKHQAIAVSYGVDMATVLKHCLAARRRARFRNLVVGLAIALSYLLFRDGAAVPNSTLAVISFGLLFLVAYAAILTEKILREHLTVRKYLLETNYNPDCVTYPGMAELVRDLSDARESNVMIYSGFSPFVGSGTNIGGWSFAVDTSRGKDDLGRIRSPQPFNVKDLYTEISASLANLGLGKLAMEDKLCVNGRDIRDDPRFLPNLLERPITKVTPDVIDGSVENPSNEVRHYKQIRVVDWSGELVLSIFLRLAKPGRNLFVETTFCLLAPVDAPYQKVDAMNPEPGILDWLWTGISCAVVTVVSWLLWPLWVAFKLLNLYGKWLIEVLSRKVIRRNPTFDRGAVSSVREDVASREYQRYFQKLDKEMYVKILEGQMIEVIVRFLDQKDIDTSDLKERRTTILNNGVIVSGTMSVQGETVAMGGQARAEKREASRPAHA